MSGAMGATLRGAPGVDPAHEGHLYAVPDGYWVYPHPWRYGAAQPPDHAYGYPLQPAQPGASLVRNPFGQGAATRFEIADASLPADSSWIMFRANDATATTDGDVVPQFWFDAVGGGANPPAQQPGATHLIAVDISAAVDANDVATALKSAIETTYPDGRLAHVTVAIIPVATPGDQVEITHSLKVPFNNSNNSARRINNSRYNLRILASEDFAGETDTQISWSVGHPLDDHEFTGGSNVADWPAIFGQNFGVLPQDGRFEPFNDNVGG